MSSLLVTTQLWKMFYTERKKKTFNWIRWRQNKEIGEMFCCCYILCANKNARIHVHIQCVYVYSAELKFCSNCFGTGILVYSSRYIGNITMKMCILKKTRKNHFPKAFARVPVILQVRQFKQFIDRNFIKLCVSWNVRKTSKAISTQISRKFS